MMRLAVSLLALGCSGCTIAGSLIGSAIPRYQPIQDLKPAVGFETRLYGERGDVLAAGTLDGYENGEVLLHDGDVHLRVPLDRIASAERKVGGYEKTGFVTGIALDGAAFIAVIAIAIAMANNQRPCWVSIVGF